MPIERCLCVLNTVIRGNNYSLSILLSVYVFWLTVSCINVTRTRIKVSNEHQAVSENSVGCKWAMQFTWNINTYIRTRSFSPSLTYTEAHTRQKPLSIRRHLQRECAKPRKAGEKLERKKINSKERQMLLRKRMNMDCIFLMKRKVV